MTNSNSLGHFPELVGFVVAESRRAVQPFLASVQKSNDLALKQKKQGFIPWDRVEKLPLGWPEMDEGPFRYFIRTVYDKLGQEKRILFFADHEEAEAAAIPEMLEERYHQHGGVCLVVLTVNPVLEYLQKLPEVYGAVETEPRALERAVNDSEIWARKLRESCPDNLVITVSEQSKNYPDLAGFLDIPEFSAKPEPPKKLRVRRVETLMKSLRPNIRILFQEAIQLLS